MMSFVHLIIHFIISYFLHLVTFQLLEERQDFIDTISKTNYYHTFYLTLCYLIYLLALSLLICLVTLHNDITFPVLLELKQSKKKKNLLALSCSLLFLLQMNQKAMLGRELFEFPFTAGQALFPGLAILAVFV